ncbi:sensor histidine kinase [Biformimicrobium ophioploci]|uniref:Signal transduction histidine kinase internal region domain-containing protein n=1 Tax=Biformimicrobium ophioploci TaxID=3036711 RepID=A0ABQ6M0W8_9GAMM|nr:histidine kinase [Microbulbifer sp. NKW57]GMG87961.1 hypothetical protein MNKW57_22820 [Microbulbifer sp. NKW57]
MDTFSPILSSPTALRLFRSKTAQFWGLQLLGWTGYFLVVYFAVVAPELNEDNWLVSHAHVFVESASGLLLSVCLHYFLRAMVRKPFHIAVVGSVLGAAIVAAIWNFVKLTTFNILYQQYWLGWGWSGFGGWYLFSFATMLSWMGLYFLFRVYRQLEQEHNKALEAENAAKEAQLKMLRYQLNPHFMFNTMNAISTLVLKRDNEAAANMLDHLCQFLRTSLESNPSIQATLRSELEVLDLYLSIEKARFGARLKYRTCVSDEARDALVPNLILQPLVENAIKYAVSASKEGGELLLEAGKEDGELVVRLSDNGPGLEGASHQDSARAGIGLKNTWTRLKTLYDDDYTFQLFDNVPHGLVVEIRIPYQSGAILNERDEVAYAIG